MNGLSNWGYNDISKLLRFRGFLFLRSLKGSYVEWENRDGQKIKFLRCYNIYSPNRIVRILEKAEIDLKIAKKWTKLTKKEKKKMKS